MTKKKIIIIVTVLVVISALIFGVLTQVVYPISFKDSKVEISSINYESYKHLYDEIKKNSETGDQVFIEDNAFPTDKSEDYNFVCVRFMVKNKSFFDVTPVEFMLDNVPDDSGIIFKEANLVQELVESGSEKLSAIGFLIQRKGRSDEEILEMITKINVTVYYDTFVKKGMKMNMSLEGATLGILEANTEE